MMNKMKIVIQLKALNQDQAKQACRVMLTHIGTQTKGAIDAIVGDPSPRAYDPPSKS